jgi:hypothetical protein
MYVQCSLINCVHLSAWPVSSSLLTLDSPAGLYLSSSADACDDCNNAHIMPILSFKSGENLLYFGQLWLMYFDFHNNSPNFTTFDFNQRFVNSVTSAMLWFITWIQQTTKTANMHRIYCETFTKALSWRAIKNIYSCFRIRTVTALWAYKKVYNDVIKAIKHNFAIPNLKIYPISQWHNSIPTETNLIFPGQKKANPNSQFTPSDFRTLIYGFGVHFLWNNISNWVKLYHFKAEVIIYKMIL